MFVAFWREEEKPTFLKMEIWKPFFCECEGKKKGEKGESN